MKRYVFLFTVFYSACGGTGWSQVSFERLIKAAQEPHNWLTYSGNYSSWRYSGLKQINTENVSELKVEWIFQTGITGKFETTPLVVDGIMYVTGQDNLACALDARTGRLLWRFQRRLPERVLPCCGRVNRGFAAFGDKVFLATLDAHVMALDAKTGNVVWDTTAEDYSKGYSFTVAPLVVKDKVIVGVSGGEYGIRGFIDAYEVETGKRAWRFYTIPGPGEAGHDTWKGDSWKIGGAPAWVTGSYDPELNLTYWGTGNPSPSDYGEDRKGDNLYSNCLVALDADTGKLKWYFQFTPHDLHDYDATQVPLLLDLESQGKPKKVLAQANRNGFFYLLDRVNGQFLLGQSFGRVTWAKEIGPDGRPLVLASADPTSEGVTVCPGAAGATNWMSPSFSPQTGFFYVSQREQCDKFMSWPQPYRPGRVYMGSNYVPDPEAKASGVVLALDPRTGKVQWEYKYFSPPWSGILSTAGGLVFAADMEGYLIALDARSGKELWHLQTGSSIYSSPMTYAVDGTQYVAIPAGAALVVVGLPDRVTSKQAANR